MTRLTDRTQARAKALDPAAQDTRRKLLDAATDVFAEVGYHAATIHKICTRAGANIALVNYHFGDKLALYIEVLRRCSRSAKMEAIRSALDQEGSAEEVLRAVIRARLHGIHAEDASGQYVRIMLHELGQPSPALTRVVKEAWRPLQTRLLQLIGTIIGLPPEHEKTRLCAISVTAQASFYHTAAPVLKTLWPELEMTPEQMDRIADHIADFSLVYLRHVRSHQQRCQQTDSTGP